MPGQKKNYSLATAVMVQAILDALVPKGHMAGRYHIPYQARRLKKIQDDALGFLTTPNEDLRYWCEILGWNVERFIERVGEILDNPNPKEAVRKLRSELDRPRKLKGEWSYI